MDVLEFADAAGWESWLKAQHGEQAEAWLRIAKRHGGIATLTIGDALDVALCYGWIDGQRRAHDDVSFLQRYSRRRPRSSWSKINVAKVEALTAAGRMRPVGLAEVAAAQADGRWAAAYESQLCAYAGGACLGWSRVNNLAQVALQDLPHLQGPGRRQNQSAEVPANVPRPPVLGEQDSGLKVTGDLVV